LRTIHRAYRGYRQEIIFPRALSPVPWISQRPISLKPRIEVAESVPREVSWIRLRWPEGRMASPPSRGRFRRRVRAQRTQVASQCRVDSYASRRL